MLADKNIPIVVDLDNTLILTDTLYESVAHLIKISPFSVFLLPFWLIKGRAFFKQAVASKVSIAPEKWPYNEDLIAYLKNEKKNGRKIFLATAAHISIANSISNHLNLFDGILATQGHQNLKGKHKLKKIQEDIGMQFIYAGDSKADIPIWNSSVSAILVNVSDNLALTVRKKVKIEREFPKR